jgi:histidyl-tRNA synthetase
MKAESRQYQMAGEGGSGERTMFWGFGKRKLKVKPPQKELKLGDKKQKFILQPPRGMKDVLPEEQKFWRFIKKIVNKNAEINGYERIDTPIVESARLFSRSIGEETDIVEKEMFYVGRGTQEGVARHGEEDEGDLLVLRPEGTAGIARAYIEYGMRTWPQPVQLFYVGPMFRYNRPQKGRLRQFYQFGFESLGTDDPTIDARLISMGYSIFKEMTLEKKITIKINTIGCAKCRPNIDEVLRNYYLRRVDLLCEDCQRRLEKNPLRLLDCKEKSCQDLFSEAPQIIDNVCGACTEHFKNVLEFLDDQDVPYDLEPRLVRGLDYYTRTTFEFVAKDDERRQNSFGGGGRYDSLIDLLGEKETPAIGMAFGIERIINLLKQEKIKVTDEEKVKVFVVQLGEAGKKQAVEVLNQLQKNNIPAQAALSRSTIKSQLKMAGNLGARFTIIIGQKEAMDKTAIIRDMKEGIQEIVDQEIVIAKLKEKLK